VTRIEVTPDLAEARIHVSVLPAEHARLTLDGLTHAVAHVQREVNSRVAMKRVPRLSFVLDDYLKKQAEVYAAIQKSSADSAEQ
jgi:ribosome-binding factor A